jgi:hypothetical protein
LQTAPNKKSLFTPSPIPQPFNPAILWLQPKPTENPFNLEQVALWQPEFVDRLVLNTKPGNIPYIKQDITIV